MTMTLDDLYRQLQAAIHDNQIILSSSLRPELGLVLDALDIAASQPLNLPSLSVTAPLLSQSVSAVTMTGSAVYRNNNCNATLVGIVAGSGYAFTLTLAINTDGPWTFKSAFSNLPDSYMPGNTVTLEPVESYLNTTQILQPAFIASNPPPALLYTNAGEDPPPAVRFTGYLDMSGPLEIYAGYLGSGPFPLDGIILMKDQDIPLFDLRGSVAGKSIDITSGLIGQLGLRLITETVDDAVYGQTSSSILLLTGSVALGSTNPVTMELSAKLLQGDFMWTLLGEFDDYTEVLSDGLEQLAGFLNIPLVDLFAPAAIKALSTFYLKDIQVALTPPDSTNPLPSLYSISGTVMTKNTWFPPIPIITVSDVGVRWQVNMNDTSPMVSGGVFGTVTLGKEPYNTSFFISARLPEFIIQCSLNKGEEFDLGQVFGWFYGGSGPQTGLKVTDLNFTAIPSTQAFKFQANITTEYNISFGNLTFTLDEVRMWYYSLQNVVSGGMMATMLIKGKEPTENSPDSFETTGFWLAASYEPDGSWLFEGGLVPGTTLELVSLVAQFLGIDTPPDGLPVTLSVEELVTSFNTGTGVYSLSGKVVGRWKISGVLDGLDISVMALADIERCPKEAFGSTPTEIRSYASDEQEMQLIGSLYGQFMVNRFFVGVGINLKEKESTYLFKLGYGDIYLIGATEWTGKDQNRHQVINFTLNGVTFGSIIEYFVNLARPGSNYRLEAPWDFLNCIDLSRFTLTVDPKENTIAFAYAIDVDLFFIKIDTVGLKYVRSDGQDAIKMVLTGRFLDQTYDTDYPLFWDVVDDPPPAVPGAGEQLLHIRYVGLGQHIALQNAANFNSVSDVINAMRDQMKPVEDTGKNPLQQPSGQLLSFDENSHWLVGLDMTIMDFISIAAIFNDPYIYGLLVSLSGANAGSLAGFRLEILYKRITDDIGVFKAVFRMPEAFRQLQFGVVSITLGTVSVEIYTNGDFKIDLGFPKNRDFSESFCLQAYIFIGHGGLYFGKLNGATSSRVPVATNGSFSPVIELGIGLAVGVGREFNKGPLSAGLYVELLAIFEGVFAWFHPHDAAQDVSMYYWARGVAGIIGKLYGCVDFKVIKVSVSVEAYATITLVLESHEPTVVLLDMGVEVKASIKILFVKINFSFGLHLHESFTIGDKTTPPWITSASVGSTPARLAAASRTRRRSAHETRMLTRLSVSDRHTSRSNLLSANILLNDGYKLVWKPDAVFPDGGVHPVTLKLIPAFTLANIGVQWANGEGTFGSPAYKLIFMLSADNGTDPQAIEHEDVRKVTLLNSTNATDTSELALNVIIESMFRWAVSAIKAAQAAGSTSADASTVTSGELEDLVNQLGLPETFRDAFNLDMLSSFFDNNLEFKISSIPEAIDADDISGVVFPMIPTLRWTSSELHGVDYSTFRPIDSNYEEEINAFFKKMLVNPPDQKPSPASENSGEEKAISMASYIFCDYFLMIARTVVQAALDAMEAYTYKLLSGDSLGSIALNPKFPGIELSYTVNAGDTPASVAAFFGITAAELLFLNPGIDDIIRNTVPGLQITVNLGLTPQAIALSNQNTELTAGITLDTGVISCQLGPDETLSGIAARFGLKAVTDLLKPLPQNLTEMSNDARLLKTGGIMSIGAYTYANSEAMTVDLVSAIIFTRLNGAAETAYIDWYSQTIFSLNQSSLKGFDADLAAGIQLVIPAALYDKEHTVLYTTVSGDTLEWIGAYFSLLQNFNADMDPDGSFGKFNKKVRTLNPAGAGAVILPDDMSHTLEPMETLDSLWKRLLLNDAADLVARIKDQKGLLLPLAAVNIPGVAYVTKAGDTLAAVSTLLNLPVLELASRPGVASAAGLFKSTGTQGEQLTLTLHDLPKMNMEDIIYLLQNGDAHSRVSGMASRFFLHGLRLPAPERKDEQSPYTATGPMTGLYELTGQQVDGPEPDSGHSPDDIIATASFTETIQKKWVTFFNSVTIDNNDNLEYLSGKHPQLRSLNPAVHMNGRFRAGAIVLTGQIPKGDESSLDVKIKEKYLKEGYPDSTLKPQVVSPLSLMKLSEASPKSYGFQQHILWQFPDAVQLPGQDTGALTGSPSIWMFPSDLTAQAQKGSNPTPPYRLMLHQGAPDVPPVEIEQFAWATLLKVVIRKVRQNETDSTFMPDTYEVMGTDQSGRLLLYELFSHLPEEDNASNSIFLLYNPSASSANPDGLCADVPDKKNTYIIKTNLTTETASGVKSMLEASSAGDPPTKGDFFASLESHRQFLLLLWECSVVGGGGFYLHYSGGDGKLLPDSIFGPDGGGSLYLNIMLSSQSAAINPERGLYRFNNSAVVGMNMDISSANLYAEITDGSQISITPTVQPGNSGFDMTLKNPEVVPPSDLKQLTAQRLYSLIGYKLGSGTSGSFVSSPEATPVSPAEAGDPSEPLSVRAERRRLRMMGIRSGDALENWQLHQVIPLARFAASHSLPDCPPLPGPSDDPYAGIQPEANAALSLWFTDVYGNTSAGYPSGTESSNATDGQLLLPSGYTDEVIGLGKWPGISSNYCVSADTGTNGAAIQIQAAFQPASFMPSMLQPLESVKEITRKQLQRYTQIYYQLAQKDIQFNMLTSLSQAAGSDPDALSMNGTPLKAFAAASCIWLSAALQLEQAYPDAASGSTLEQISAFYNMTYAELGLYNINLPLKQIFTSASISTPQYIIFSQGDSAVSICSKLSRKGLGITPVELLSEPENLILPLRPGTALTITPRTAVISATAPSLNQIAQINKCTPSNLASRNSDTRGLLVIDQELVYQGLSLTVAEASPDGPTQSFNDMAQRFITEMDIDSRTTGADIAMANQDSTAIFTEGASITVSDYTSLAGDTLMANQSGISKENLIALNTAAINIFDAGAAVYYGPTDHTTEGTVGEFCNTYGLTPEQLFQHNRSLTLASPLAIMLPGAVSQPGQKSSVRIPYQIKAQDSLASIAGMFDVPGTDLSGKMLYLANLNQAMPYVFAPGKTITVDGTSIQTQAGDSFKSVLEQFKSAGHEITLSQLVAAMGQTSGVLNASALFICPPALVAQGSTAISLETLSESYGIAVLLLAASNSALTGIIAADVELSVRVSVCSQGQYIIKEYKETTNAHDTLNSIVSRFNRQTPTSLEDVVLANQKAAVITSGCNLLLPPATASLSATVGQNATKYSSSVFPVTVALEIRRPEQLIHPDFKDNAPTQYDRTLIPPYTTRSSDKNGPMRLQSFARSFQSAIPSLWLATSKSGNNAEGLLTSQSSVQDLWAVCFDAGGISKVSVKKGVSYPGKPGMLFPRFFALKPLENKHSSENGVMLRPLNDDGTLGEGKSVDYQGVDLEIWARKFLSDMDLFLSAAYTAPLWRLNNGAHRITVDKIVAAKKALCQAISMGVDYVLTTDAPSDDAAKSSAQSQLEQQLRVSLSRAYATDIILQYDSAAVSQCLSKPARLCGQVKVLPPVAADDENSNATKYSITNSKTPLQTGSSYVNFLLDVSNEQLQQSVILNLKYLFNELEFNIQDVQGIEGYQSSNWLSFILPIGEEGSPACFDIDLGQSVVPLPLRTYPENPQLVSQLAIASKNPDKTPDFSISDAALWNYLFTYEHRDAGQDKLQLTVRINEAEPAPETLLAADNIPSLLQTLAQYTAVFEKLWSTLARLTKLPSDGNDPSLDNAVETFAALAADIATSWKSHWAPAQLKLQKENITPTDVYDYTVKLNPGSSGQYYSTLSLGYNQSKPWPGTVAPDIICIDEDGKEIALTKGTASEGICSYSFGDSIVPVFSRLRFRLSFKELNVISQQNALSLASVSRNQDIFSIQSESTPFVVPTNPAFVFQTPKVGFANTTIPLLSWDVQLPFGQSGSLEDAIRNLFSSILGSTSTERELSVSVQYGYTLVAGSGEAKSIVMRMPVLFKPRFKYSDDIPHQLYTALTGWNALNQPNTKYGYWNFSVNVFSSIANAPQLPVLELKQLTTSIRGTGIKTRILYAKD